jgi:hypothetical protein
MSLVSSDDETYLIVMMSSIRKCWFSCGDSVFPNFQNCHFAVLQISVIKIAHHNFFSVRI